MAGYVLVSGTGVIGTSYLSNESDKSSFMYWTADLEKAKVFESIGKLLSFFGNRMYREGKGGVGFSSEYLDIRWDSVTIAKLTEKTVRTLEKV